MNLVLAPGYPASSERHSSCIPTTLLGNLPMPIRSSDMVGHSWTFLPRLAQSDELYVALLTSTVLQRKSPEHSAK